MANAYSKLVTNTFMMKVVFKMIQLIVKLELFFHSFKVFEWWYILLVYL